MTGNSQQGWRRFVVPALIVGTAIAGGLAFMGNATDDSRERGSEYARCIAAGGSPAECD